MTIDSLFRAAVLWVALTAIAAAAEPARVLFVDTGNTGRSISAETLARLYAAVAHKPLMVISRGVDIDPFEPEVEMNAQILWRQRGIDLSAHRAEQITAQDVKRASVILCLTAKHQARVLDAFPDAKAKTFLLTEYAVGKAEDIEDAYGKPLESYQAMLAALDKYVPAAVDRATREAAAAP